VVGHSPPETVGRKEKKKKEIGLDDDLGRVQVGYSLAITAVLRVKILGRIMRLALCCLVKLSLGYAIFGRRWPSPRRDGQLAGRVLCRQN